MKKITTLITTFFILSFFAALSARADVIWQELFNYPNGLSTINSTNVVGGVMVTNWLLHSGTADSQINNDRLEVSSTTAYLGVTATRSGDIHRNFAIAPGSPYTNAQQFLYASFFVNFTNPPLPNGAYFAHFYINSTTFEGKLWALTGNPGGTSNNFTALPNTFRLGVSAGTSGISSAQPSTIFPVDLALNANYQVVLFWDPVNNDDITLWINPISSSDPSAVSGDAYTPTSANIANSFAFRQASGFGGFLDVSNVVLATTFSEAATNVWPTNAMAPVIVYQPAGVNNFANSTFSLSAVADGQGLGSMAYQWQVSAAANNSSPANVSGGNFSGTTVNVLTDNSAQVGDTGYYSLIATTPWGLSATSSVAHVSIAQAKVPPSFITEPVSQTIYRGQTITLSASVISPGNVTFTWKSNNVDMVGADVGGSGDSSTLTLHNVTTGVSANYRVAATNDYAGYPTNGVVSTNGVVTVLNPPVVSIAYLRSLQDPITFAPTVPLTQPFQVTGTVTTFTNVTTGNTASYYLQDGTGGINIFATGASSFRPAQGDSVTYVGVLSQFGSGFELYADTTPTPAFPYTSYVDNGGPNPLPTPITLPMNYFSAYGADYVNFTIGGSLVKLEDVYFGTNAGTTISTSANEFVTVTNSIGQSCSLAFFDLDLDTAGQTLPTYAYSVTGVLYGDATTWDIAVTRFADINTSPSEIPLYSSVSGGNITLTWGGSVFELQSAPSPAGPWTTISSSSPYTTSTSGSATFFRLYYSNLVL